MTWQVSLFIAAIFIAASNIIARNFSGKIHPILSTALFAIAALVVTAVGIGISKLQGAHTVTATREGILFALLAGLVWGVGQVLWLTSLSQAPLAIVLPLIMGGIGFFSVLAGFIFYKETLSFIQLSGVVILIVGSILISIPK